jgi:plastocyanin
VTVSSGPATVASPAKAAGVYSARLTKPGTYEFVCAIHAPGMRMAAVVR